MKRTTTLFLMAAGLILALLICSLAITAFSSQASDLAGSAADIAEAQSVEALAEANRDASRATVQVLWGVIFILLIVAAGIRIGLRTTLLVDTWGKQLPQPQSGMWIPGPHTHWGKAARRQSRPIPAHLPASLPDAPVPFALPEAPPGYIVVEDDGDDDLADLFFKNWR
ncbi:MAG: hypothetical protein ACE5GO_01410 [Anaerolineales bacterium]